MILVDTSVWIDHLRARNVALVASLDAAEVLVHPFVIGELALGHLQERRLVLDTLGALPRAQFASDAEVLQFIAHHRLFGSGIGYIDAHLLAAARLTSDARLWTLDKRLEGVADRLSLAVIPS